MTILLLTQPYANCFQVDRYDGTVLVYTQHGQLDDKATVAECLYYALGFGLKHLAAAGHPPGPIDIVTDNRLVDQQIAGRWACAHPVLKKLLDRCLLRAKEHGWELRTAPPEESPSPRKCWRPSRN